MKLTYRKEGDCFLPNLDAPGAPKIEKYGMLRRSFLRREKQGIYTGLLISGKLNRHLEEIDHQAKEMAERLFLQLVTLQGVTEELKSENQIKWVGIMNSIRASVEEIVLKELIYN